MPWHCRSHGEIPPDDVRLLTEASPHGNERDRFGCLLDFTPPAREDHGMTSTASTTEPAGAQRFRKRPIVIEAIHFTGTGESCTAVTAFFGTPYAGTHRWKSTTNHGGWIITPEGEMEFKPGDWIIRGVKGEYYPCRADIFEATYEPADQQPTTWVHSCGRTASRTDGGTPQHCSSCGEPGIWQTTVTLAAGGAR